MRIKAILVDDDKLALHILKHDLKKHSDIKIEGLFTDPLAALKKIEEIKPDVVFLDIDMPQLKGIDAASQIVDIYHHTEIVFVTSHNRYAVDAFEVNALDYLVKPVSKKRLEKTIQKLLNRKQSLFNQPSQPLKSVDILEIKCFGQFQIKWKDEHPIKWRSRLTRELSAFLIQNSGKETSKECILEELWPDEKCQTSVARLYSGMHYIRKALEDYNIKRELIELRGKYFIELSPEVRTDIVLFEDAVTDIDENTEVSVLESIEALYTGEYLEGETWLWAYPERERIHNIYLQFTVKLARKYIAFSLYEKAEAILLKVFRKNPYDEIITSLLLEVYKITNQKNKASMHFSTYAKLLQSELAINPQRDIRILYNSIK